MNALSYARRFVRFLGSSPIQGAFDESRYPFCIKPIQCADDIRVKSQVLYKPAQSLGTVILQILTAYRLDVVRKTVMAIAQTDDDAKNFSTIKLAPFLDQIPSLTSTLRPGRYSKTLSHWLWANHELIISGPGPNAQNSTSCCYLHTDEAHLWNVFYPGAFKALLDRMGPRYDRSALHVTTSADAGTDVDLCYHESSQDEWHVRCLHCNFLFQPVWTENAQELYNGERVFHYTESQSEAETLDSLVMKCPQCGCDHKDSPLMRKEMDEGADYVSMNPDAKESMKSYRYNAFAPRWRPHRDLLAIYLAAIQAVKLGKLEPYENWIKKQLCLTWTGEFPQLGISGGAKNYSLGEIDPNPTSLRVCSFDIQEGIGGEGFHIWGQADEFDRDGIHSKRLAYEKLATYDDARAFQMRHKVQDKHVGMDFGHRDREVFAVCEKYHWTAMKSGDEEQFAHNIHDRKSGRTTTIYLPYSTDRMELVSGILNKRIEMLYRNNQRIIPPGYCKSILWSKPVIYQLLYNLKSGIAGREYGIANDMPDAYEKQLHSYMPSLELDKKTGLAKKLVWKIIRPLDHAFITSAQNLLIAIKAGFYPLSETKTQEKTA